MTAEPRAQRPDEVLDELETLLLRADVGVKATEIGRAHV